MTDILTKTPKVQYNQILSTNLLTKIAVIKQHFDKFTIYFPYTVHDGERPDTIAYDYYGDSTYAWLVMFANEIYDPYYDWPLTSKQFHSYLRKKYGHINPLKNQISHYEYQGIEGNSKEQIDRVNYKKSIDSYNAMTVEARSGWRPIYVYDYEQRLNEQKRTIRLLSNQYLPLVDVEIQTIFDGYK